MAARYDVAAGTTVAGAPIPAGLQTAQQIVDAINAGSPTCSASLTTRGEVRVAALARGVRAPAMTKADRARVPAGLGWAPVGTVGDPQTGATLFAWWHAATSTQVLSSLVIAELPRGGATGPQWHASLVDRTHDAPMRPSDAQTRLARCAFDLLTAEEDNHHPGAARQFWLPVDPAERRDCECKETEVQVVEADGYRWSNDPDSCRGCALEGTMRAIGRTTPCPLHATTTADVSTGAP